MRLWRNFRFRLALVFLLAALVPLLLIGAVTLRMAEGYLEDSAVRSHRAVLDGLTGGMELFLSHRVYQLQLLARELDVQRLGSHDASEALRSYLSRDTFFSHLYLYGTDGTVEALALRHGDAATQGWVKENVAKLDCPVQKVAAKNLPSVILHGKVVTVPNIPGQNQYRTALFLLPIADFADPKRIRGALGARAILDGSEIQAILGAQLSRRAGYVCILNGLGEIVARQGPALAATARRFIIPADFAEGAEAAVRTVLVDNGGRTDLLSLSYRPSIGGWVVVGQPVDDAFRLSRALREHFLVIVALAVLLAVMASTALSGTVTRPISALTEGLTRVRQGVFSHRIDDPPDDELGDACLALNGLAKTLQKEAVIGAKWVEMREGGTKGT